MYRIVLAALLLPILLAPAHATQTCDPSNVVCTGNSGSDPYAACHGEWADAYGAPAMYVQVCRGYDGTDHLYVCPLSNDWRSPRCVHQAL